jgi:hypothetical protein
MPEEGAMRSRLAMVLALVCGLGPALAAAQTYRWVDESGRVQYSNLPPPLQPVPDDLPAPRIAVSGPVRIEMRGRALRGYLVEVTNRSVYPQAFFTPPPGGPACGRTHGARTLVDIYTVDGKRLRGFCDVRAPEELSELRFAIAELGAQPDAVYVVFTDRVKNREYRSNNAPVPGR